MTTLALESIIKCLVENQVKEIKEKNNKMKRIFYKNRKLMKKDKKLKSLYTKALEKMKQYNNKINEKENIITKLERLHT